MDNFLPGSASLVDCIDKKILVILRDGRKLIGWLRSYDQFANLVLQDTVERTYVAGQYGDVYRGIFVIRGENVVLLGEIDKEKEQNLMKQLQNVPIAEVREAQKREQERGKIREKARKRVLESRGFSVDVLEQHDSY
ncbi:SM-like, degradation of cytoplasmic mRNAs and positively regulates transcription initiation [Geranomyces variabilis]|nr:u6 snRNA-associated Sm-like protein LSm1-like protein [Geranomyces variabilis]KAJ3143384.1 SM-like, degradation of cytoplasmic mRNAs and positively regulates transcription initiation [Geranomyces variabilis]KAJ3157032.1 SM-like, degradation of cytoplasmic mRNAs and positively regulates transcription initiation [Geranomyces variabilis]KAJ3166939.1 SM-like, degradation of cytoplasmic mRNAs and positively regulates transcription initiation [Geranomyces variabilis]